MTGILHLIGVGPGDPELLTLKAARLIAAADVVGYPHKPGEPSLALAIAGHNVRPSARRLPVEVPMAVDPAAAAAYDAAAKAIASEVRADRAVVYLCEGDALFYGSAIALLDRLAGRIPVAIVPGVTSITASAAAARRPLAARNDIFKVLPGPLDDATLEAELRGGCAAAIIKPGRHTARIRDLLVWLGRGPDAVVVEKASGADQRVTALEHLEASSDAYFATILVPSARLRP